MKRYVQPLHSCNMFQSCEEALDWLYQQKKSKKRENLDRINFLIDALDLRPKYHIIHIAGTNGKGSTASYLNQMLILRNYRVGMFVSPYVIKFNERIEVNGAYISDADVLRFTSELQRIALDYYQETKDTIPFFELTFLMALLYFKEKQIDYLILECGLGGILDATNALDKDAAVITNIGYDHMQQLGNTLEEISQHKLGITRPFVPCFTTVDPALQPIFEAYASKHQIPMQYVLKDISNIKVYDEGVSFSYKNKEYLTSLGGIYQAQNASLALAVMNYLDSKYPYELAKKALKTTFWPGRFERFGGNIILDGAHNLPGMVGLKESLELIYPGCSIKVVFTALKDKAIKEMLSVLDAITDQYYFTTFLDNRSSDPTMFLTDKPYQIYSDYKEAIEVAIKELQPKEILVITGSLHFISEARKILNTRNR